VANRANAFRYPLRERPWPPGSYGWTVCAVCRRAWRPSPGSVLQCHATCLFTTQAIAAMLRTTRPMPELARHYGVTARILAAALGTGRRGR